MQNNQVKVKKKNEKLVDGITNMSLAWKVETCKKYKLSITGLGGGGLKTNGQSMKESKSHIRHCVF